jgi:hypothetical protein
VGSGPHCPMVSGRSSLDKTGLAKTNTIEVNLDAGFDKGPSSEQSFPWLRFLATQATGTSSRKEGFGPAEGPLQDPSRVAIHAAFAEQRLREKVRNAGGPTDSFWGDMHILIDSPPGTRERL